MNIVVINRTPEQHKSAVGRLQDELEAVISRFCTEHGEMPVTVVLGVLRLVEHNFIARI